MRISGGKLRGRTIPSPTNQGTRPTTERIREALFSMLMTKLDGSRVLDLYAGSGMLGLEAISRGAALACFIEQHPATAGRLRKLISEFQLIQQAEVFNGDVAPDTLFQIKKHATLKWGGHVDFNLLFLDPPYGKGLAAGTLSMLATSGILAAGAIAAVEHEATAESSAIFRPPWRLWKTRRHGTTGITLLILGDAVEPTPTNTAIDGQ